MRKYLLAACFLLAIGISLHAQSRDSEQLGRAIDYFQGRKYHEALLLFEKLDRRYKLNPRFLAYMGVCYFYEWNYEKACLYLDSVMPQLQVFAPHERSVYCYTAAESHFQQEDFAMAIPLYEQGLLLCHANEKPDMFYRLGLCHLQLGDKASAEESFTSALAYYQRYRNTPDDQPRITQIEHMLGGLRQELRPRHEEE